MDYAEASANVELINRPTKQQFEFWDGWVRWDLQCDDDGWWIGWCPLHESIRGVGEGSCAFNFRKGSFRCMTGCTGTKAMSIVRLIEAIAGKYLNG